MARKNVLPYQVATNQSLAADFTSAATVIAYLDNCSYQINVTTSDSIGVIYVQASNDYQVSEPSGVVTNQGNWFDLTLTTSPVVNAANDVIGINLNQLPFQAVRIRYDATTAGTGTCNIYVVNKQVGG